MKINRTIKLIVCAFLFINLTVGTGISFTNAESTPSPLEQLKIDAEKVTQQKIKILEAEIKKLKIPVTKKEEEIKNIEKLIKERETKKLSTSTQKTELDKLKKELETLKKPLTDKEKELANLKSPQSSLERQKAAESFRQTALANLDKEKAALDSQLKNKQITETEYQKQLAVINNKKSQINQEFNWEQAIERDREVFNVGILLKADNQKTYLEKAKAANAPVILTIIKELTTFALKLIIPIAVLAIIAGGYLMMFAGGEDNKLGKGKDTIKAAVIGIIIAFSSYLIVQLIISVFYQNA
ncbi:hypothetical protein KKG71_05600 [Patescibacteria group bacterium]|nr:hypothetical protein [Patescibacteria group bacterium]